MVAAGYLGVGFALRPVAHFTAARGWINDPYGVQWDGDRYRMCYQAVPDDTEWSPACAWGLAVSDDLVIWSERGLVLVPGPFELGCWSGCLVGDPNGETRAFYTRIVEGEPELGQIAVARCDGNGRLIASADDVVVTRPPGEVAVTSFRDPYVWPDRGGWTMIVGGGTAGGAGTVLCYRSTDLSQWRYVGVLHRGHAAVAREVWECPQMIQIDQDWVLVVSVQVDGSAGHVAARVGGFDGTRFTPDARWQRLAFGSSPYATSLFRDRDGRPCMISWLREAPWHRTDPAGWSGAHSIVAVLGIDGTRKVIASPHPAVPASGVFTHRSQSRDWIELEPGVPSHVTVTHEDPIELRAGERCLARVRRSTAGGLLIERPGADPDVLPCRAADQVELFLDADILEIFSSGRYGAWRLCF
jgi:beta-fructofuranosidase